MTWVDAVGCVLWLTAGWPIFKPVVESVMAVKPYAGNDKQFVALCEKAGIKPTARQYRKYKQGRGAAYQAR